MEAAAARMANAAERSRIELVDGSVITGEVHFAAYFFNNERYCFRSSFSKKTVSRLLPLWITWCGYPAATARPILGMSDFIDWKPACQEKWDVSLFSQ
jgi:hypothetical protein